MLKTITNFLALAFCLCLLFFCSCSDINQDIIIDEDGIPLTRIQLTPHTFFPQEAIKGMMSDSIAAIDSLEAEGEEEKSFLERAFNGIVHLDTTINFREDTAYANMRDTFPLEQIFRKFAFKYSGDTTLNQSKFELVMEFEEDFYMGFAGIIQQIKKGEGKNMEFLPQSYENLDSDSLEIFKSRLVEMIKQASIDQKFWFDRGIVRFPAAGLSSLKDLIPDEEDDKGEKNKFDFFKSELDQMDEEGDAEDEMMAEMARSMLGRMILKVQLPGEVEFTNDPDAEIQGNTVIFRKSLYDYIMSKDQQDRIIKFKK